MPDIHRSALMPYRAEALYDIVNDVDRYPEFLPWCGGVRNDHVDDDSLQAAILMKAPGLNHWFKTRNRMTPGRVIDMELVEGPFSELYGRWQFTPLGDDGSKIELSLHFEIKNGLAAAVITPAFSKIANTMVESFCDRARALYGN